jgi:hypothetical protein
MQRIILNDRARPHAAHEFTGHLNQDSMISKAPLPSGKEGRRGFLHHETQRGGMGLSVKVHRSRAMHKMNAGSLPELGRMVDKLKLLTEKPQRS